MRIKEKIYPYPVIKEPEADFLDYKDSNFDFDIELIESESDSDYALKINCKNTNIPDKLLPNSNNNIFYGYQVESVFNKNRFFKFSKENNIIISISSDDFINKVEINAFIFANEKLSIYLENQDGGVDDFYRGQVEFPKGGIIASARPTKTIFVNSDGLNKINPIRIKKDDTVKTIRFRPDNSFIEVSLNPEIYKIYNRYGFDRNYKIFIYNSIVVPAVNNALLFLSQDQSEGTIDIENGWARDFLSVLSESGYSIEDINSKISSEEATQIILKNPIVNMFKKLKDISKGD